MENKIHIILAYYRRPKIALNALHSIKHSSYQNWILTIIDDSGDTEFESVVNDYDIPDSKLNYIPVLDTESDKLNNGGSRHGQFINNSIRSVESDITIVLCDDDALHYQYLEYLNEFYNLNELVNWSYCKLYFYNPDTEWYYESNDTTTSMYQHIGSTYQLNHYLDPINPAGILDSSQISFRTSVFNDPRVGYPSPQTRGLDFYLFNSLYNVVGDCYPNYTYGQYKGCFAGQLGNRYADTKNEFNI
jgi:hypothetical protein